MSFALSRDWVITVMILGESNGFIGKFGPRYINEQQMRTQVSIHIHSTTIELRDGDKSRIKDLLTPNSWSLQMKGGTDPTSNRQPEIGHIPTKEGRLQS